MLDAQTEAQFRAALVAIAGGYLRNPVRLEGITCRVCTRPVTGYKYCFQCNSHRAYSAFGLANIVAPITYGVARTQSGYVMRGYKARPPVDEHHRIVGMLILLALSTHTKCASALAGMPVTHWATVPSLPAKPGEHPLHKIVGSVAPGREVTLIAATATDSPRNLNPDHFTADRRLPRGSHVLLMDDTWVRGGHAQSAVIALRKSGADYVSLLIVSRWVVVKDEFADHTEFFGELSDRDYDPDICPWTGGSCP
jgi:hypothetical protein